MTTTAIRTHLDGQLLTPGDAGYDAARQVWNGAIDRKPGLIARCTGAGDVIRAVEFAREQRLLVSVRGGGHNVTGNAVSDGGLMIDLSFMKGLRIDPVARTTSPNGPYSYSAARFPVAVSYSARTLPLPS